MFMEMEDEIRDFVTIYKKDFLEQKIDRRKEYRPEPEYPPPLNILNGPYKMYLNTRRENLSKVKNNIIVIISIDVYRVINILCSVTRRYYRDRISIFQNNLLHNSSMSDYVCDPT